jgi:hypothetical protein
MRKLTGRMERAAVLVAEDHLFDEAIAAKVGVTRRTLAGWKQQPLFAARVQVVTGELADRARYRGIARRERRLAVLQETHNKLLQVIEERSADPDLADAAGGKTGLIVRKPVVFGAKVVGFEYAVDVPTIKQLQSLQEQAAKELGQIVERREHRVIRTLDDILRELSDEELEAAMAASGGGPIAALDGSGSAADAAAVTTTSPQTRRGARAVSQNRRAKES